MNGKVILVGAGPGNKGLLTLRGAEALATADVVVFDRLVGEDILAMIPRAAEAIDVGKKSNFHPVPQTQINQILVQKAKEGKQVVRLKGGDCYLFGRGGEEVETLVQAGISFEVVPGITSALAAPAWAGIPVTHRDFCSSVHIITAHAKEGSETSIDFDALVRTGGTLVFLMGVNALPMLVTGLQQAGMDASMPMAMIENGTRANQRVVVASLGTMLEEATRHQVQSPATIVAGKVCALSDTLNWASHLPLCGKKIWVTRPKEKRGTLADKLRALGADVQEMPCIETITKKDGKLPADFKQYTWIVFTSAKGIEATKELLFQDGRDLRALAHCKIACVGKTTADALAQYGICADFMPDVFDANHLAQGLCKHLGAEDRILWVRAVEVAQDMGVIWDAHAVPYDTVCVYETHLCSPFTTKDIEQMMHKQVDAVTFSSGSMVHSFAKVIPQAYLPFVRAVCIGNTTASIAKSYGMQVLQAKHATVEDMVTCILEEV